MKNKIKIIVILSFIALPVYSQYFTDPTGATTRLIKTVQVAPITETNPSNLLTSSVFAPGVLSVADVTPVVARPVPIAIPTMPVTTPMPIPIPVPEALPVGYMPLPPMQQSRGPHMRQQQVTLVKPVKTELPQPEQSIPTPEDKPGTIQIVTQAPSADTSRIPIEAAAQAPESTGSDEEQDKLQREI